MQVVTYVCELPDATGFLMLAQLGTRVYLLHARNLETRVSSYHYTSMYNSRASGLVLQALQAQCSGSYSRG